MRLGLKFSVLAFLMLQFMSFSSVAEYRSFKKLASCETEAEGLPHPLVVSPKGDKIVADVGDDKTQMMLFDLTSGRCVLKDRVDLWQLTRNLLFSPDGSSIVHAFIEDGEMTTVVRDINENLKILRKFSGYSGMVLAAVSFTDDGKQLVSIDTKGEVLVLDFETLSVARKLNIGVHVVEAAFSKNAEKILVETKVQTENSKSCALRIFEVSSKKTLCERTIDEPKAMNFLSPPTFSADGLKIMAGQNEKYLRVWNSAKLEVEHSFEVEHRHARWAFSPVEPNILAYTRRRNELHIVELADDDGQIKKTHQTIEFEAEMSGSTVAFSADGETLAVGIRPGIIQVFRREKK